MIIIELVKDCMMLLLIVLFGIVGGGVSGLDKCNSNKKLPPLSYNSKAAQVVCRLFLVLGCIFCLFVNFPHYQEWRFSFMNVVLFPFIGLVYLAVSWVATFCFFKFGRRLLDWIFGG